MKLRMIDYVANPGGGIRFATELLRALVADRRDIELELVSHGAALATYQAVVNSERLAVRVVDIRPRRYWTTIPLTRVMGIPGMRQIKRFLGYVRNWHYEVPPSTLEHCDVVWFPWLHRHRLPISARHVVGSFHDTIIFLRPGLVPARFVRDEQQTVLRWLASPARIAVSSQTTLATVADLFGAPKERFAVIPLSGSHINGSPGRKPGLPWAWATGKFILCPANTSPHKNHEVLLEGVAAWGPKVPVVLTGYGTDLSPKDARGRALRRLAESRGLRIGDTLIPLGYVSNEVYQQLLPRAWALVMPSLLEGGGSFPVLEAMVRGVPVVCSDIPVMREQMARTGGEALWFDPHDPKDLAKTLQDLQEHYEARKASAVAQRSRLRLRTWKDVAADYWSLFEAARLRTR